MKMNVGDAGLCGIAMVASYPVKEVRRVMSVHSPMTHMCLTDPQPPHAPSPRPRAPNPARARARAVRRLCVVPCWQHVLLHEGLLWRVLCVCMLPHAQGHLLRVRCGLVDHVRINIASHSDHQHCCPENLPVCDVDAGRCLSAPGNMTGSVAWSLKEPARQTKKTSWLQKMRLDEQ